MSIYITLLSRKSNALNTLVSGGFLSQVFRPCLKDSWFCCARRSPARSFRPWGGAQRMLGIQQWIADGVAPPSVAVWLCGFCVPTASVTGVQQLTRYCGALLCRRLCMMTPSLYVTRSATWASVSHHAIFESGHGRTFLCHWRHVRQRS